MFLLLVGQQLVNKLPDDLLSWSIQDRKDIHDQSIHIPIPQKQKKLTFSNHTKLYLEAIMTPFFNVRQLIVCELTSYNHLNAHNGVQLP